MPVDPELLSMLCCPATHEPLHALDEAHRARLNRAIETGGVRYADGRPVERPLDEGLITRDGKTIYRVDDGIPVMLVEHGIPAEGVGERSGGDEDAVGSRNPDSGDASPNGP